MAGLAGGCNEGQGSSLGPARQPDEVLTVSVQCATPGPLGEEITYLVPFSPTGDSLKDVSVSVSIESPLSPLSIVVGSARFGPTGGSTGSYASGEMIVIAVSATEARFAEATFTYQVSFVDEESRSNTLWLAKVTYVNECADPDLAPDPERCIALSDLPDILFGKKLDLNGEDNFQLFGVNLDGTDLKRVKDNAFRDRHPCWSRDGSKLAFTSNRLGFGEDAYEAFLAAGTMCDIRRITYETSAGDTDGVREIALSPDGMKLAYSARGDIFVTDIDPGGLFDPLTQGAEDDRSPIWSPDGAQIAFLRGMELWVMDADGSDVGVLDQRDQVLTAAWSPGPRIAMVRFPEGLGTLEGNGSVVPFGDGTAPLDGSALAWSPDGDAIAIHKATGTIWIVRETGTTAISVGVPADRIEGLTWRAPPP